MLLWIPIAFACLYFLWILHVAVVRWLGKVSRKRQMRLGRFRIGWERFTVYFVKN